MGNRGCQPVVLSYIRVILGKFWVDSIFCTTLSKLFKMISETLKKKLIPFDPNDSSSAVIQKAGGHSCPSHCMFQRHGWKKVFMKDQKKIKTPIFYLKIHEKSCFQLGKTPIFSSKIRYCSYIQEKSKFLYKLFL